MLLSDKHDQVLPAFIKARSLIETGVKKGRENKHLKSKFANLEDVMENIQPALDDANLIIIQNATMNDQCVDVNTIIMHTESFQTISFNSLIPIAKMDGQAFGSGHSYGRKYACIGIFGLVTTDDDAEGTKKTAADVKRALNLEETVDGMDGVMRYAKNYFKGDQTSLNVIQAHYDKLKADKQADSAVNFNALKPTPKQQKNEPSAPVGEDVDPVDNF